MSDGVEWALEYAGGAERLWEECGWVLAAKGVVVVSVDAVLLGWLVDAGRVFYVHLAYGEMNKLVELARQCLGVRADWVERVRFERGSRDGDRGMREVALEKLLKIKD